MVVGVFPALKLGVLFIKQISKPLARVLVSHAKNHPVFRTYFIIPPAQFYHWAEVKAKMYLMNLGKPTKVAKLNEAMAIELGANLLGEVVIFSVAGGCLLLEYNRQVNKETKKEELRQSQIQKFTSDIEMLHATTMQQEAEIKYLQKSVEELAMKAKVKLPIKPVEYVYPIQDKSREKGEPTNEEVDNRSIFRRALDYYQKGSKSNETMS